MPLQAPEAIQVSAFVVLQLSVEDPPEATEVGLALKFRVGEAGGAGGGGGTGSAGSPKKVTTSR